MLHSQSFQGHAAEFLLTGVHIYKRANKNSGNWFQKFPDFVCNALLTGFTHGTPEA